MNPTTYLLLSGGESFRPGTRLTMAFSSDPNQLDESNEHIKVLNDALVKIFNESEKSGRSIVDVAYGVYGGHMLGGLIREAVKTTENRRIEIELAGTPAKPTHFVTAMKVIDKACIGVAQNTAAIQFKIGSHVSKTNARLARAYIARRELYWTPKSMLGGVVHAMALVGADKARHARNQASETLRSRL